MTDTFPPLPEDEPEVHKKGLTWWGWKEDVFRICLVCAMLVQIALLAILCLNQEQTFLIEPPQLTVDIDCQIDGTCAFSTTDTTVTETDEGDVPGDG